MSRTTSNPSNRRAPRGLSAEVTSFVGRRHEVAEVRRLLSVSRMVTLTGMGGVGKSRLATRVAREVHRAFPDGVFLVELAGMAAPGAHHGPDESGAADGRRSRDSLTALTRVVADALGLPLPTAGGKDAEQECPLDPLAEQLRGKRTLMIMDNCEHLLGDCAVLVETLLRSTPDLRVLATSRQALCVAGEHLLVVPPLRPPPPDGTRARSSVQSEAVQLFTERAKAVLPDFALTDANRDAVEEICRRLDGVPLAIELAAVRLRVLSPQQLLDRLDDRFRLLTSGSPAVPARHRTLRALVDWSHALCTDQERLLWARTSVFRGGLDLEAAEEVCSGDGIARADVIDLVAGLVDKSVLIRDEHPSGMRYRLPETMRRYGAELLAGTGEEAVLRDKHRDHYRNVAAAAKAVVFTAEQVNRFARLNPERLNLRAALERYFTDPVEAATGLDMATDLVYHWVTGTDLEEGRRWLDRGLATSTEPSSARARALCANSRLTMIQVETAATESDPGGPRAHCQGTSGSALVDRAEELADESIAIAEKLGLKAVQGYAQLCCGMIAMCRGRPESAAAHYRDAVARHRSSGELAGLALSLMRLSLTHSVLGDPETAAALAKECRDLCVAHEEGWHRTYAIMALGVAAWREGDTREASELAKESLRFSQAIDDPLCLGIACELLAWIAATEGRHQRAAQLLGTRAAGWRPVGRSPGRFNGMGPFHDECVAATRRALGEAGFRAAVTGGAELSRDAALNYAIHDRAPGGEATGGVTPSPLTRRETEIAKLVAKGLSNKEIATALTIAQRTAEGHIEHILGKLGFNSRTQVAVWVGEQQLDGHAAPTSGPE